MACEWLQYNLIGILGFKRSLEKLIQNPNVDAVCVHENPGVREGK